MRKLAQESNKVMSNEFASVDLTAGQLNAIVKKLGGHDMAIKFLQGKLIVIKNTIRSCLKRIFEGEQIVIARTSGKENLAHAKDVFTGWVDPDFVGYGCDVEDKPTADTPVEIFEMVEDGDFVRMFGGFNVGLNQLCLSQHQIKVFVKDHRDKLRTGGHPTFFLFKVGDKPFVAFVRVDDGGWLSVIAYRFSNDYVWDADYRHRVVVPKLVLVN